DLPAALRDGAWPDRVPRHPGRAARQRIRPQGVAGGVRGAVPGSAWRIMKAAICYEFDQPVRVEEVTLDRPGRDEVRVRIAACGVCHSDLSVIRGILRSKLPCVLGHEGAGVVEEVGEAVTGLRPGDKVVLSWVMSCSRCFYCRMGKPQLCELGERINKTNRMPDGSTRV